jgi:hypothetical protein
VPTHWKFNRFISSSERGFPVKAVYLEMNGFDLNYDRWYFDYFAYDFNSPYGLPLRQGVFNLSR